jgi:hypothetical protein
MFSHYRVTLPEIFFFVNVSQTYLRDLSIKDIFHYIFCINPHVPEWYMDYFS